MVKVIIFKILVLIPPSFFLSCSQSYGGGKYVWWIGQSYPTFPSPLPSSIIWAFDFGTLPLHVFSTSLPPPYMSMRIGGEEKFAENCYFPPPPNLNGQKVNKRAEIPPSFFPHSLASKNDDVLLLFSLFLVLSQSLWLMVSRNPCLPLRDSPSPNVLIDIRWRKI